MLKIAEPFNLKAKALEHFELARESRDALLDLQRSYRNLNELLENGSPVSPREFSGFIDLAERARVINREGMKASGFAYAVNEEAMLKKTHVDRADVMPTADHIMMQVNRVLRVLNRKPGAYNPAHSPLYGTALQDWTPLLP